MGLLCVSTLSVRSTQESTQKSESPRLWEGEECARVLPPSPRFKVALATYSYSVPVAGGTGPSSGVARLVDARSA